MHLGKANRCYSTVLGIHSEDSEDSEDSSSEEQCFSLKKGLYLEDKGAGEVSS